LKRSIVDIGYQQFRNELIASAYSNYFVDTIQVLVNCFRADFQSQGYFSVLLTFHTLNRDLNFAEREGPSLKQVPFIL